MLNTQGSSILGDSAQIFQFSGTAGTRLFFNWQSVSNSNAYYQIFRQDNNALNGNSPYSNYQYFGNPFDVTLPSDGSYILVLIWPKWRLQCLSVQC